MNKATELLLPKVNYFQVVFTLPDQLSGLALGHRREIYALLMRSAWRALQEVLRETQGIEPAALANVVKNAFEAFVATGTKLREGTIEISAALAGDHVTIVVRDDGQGMSQEEARGPLLFTPGRRNKTKKHSTGYGLPIAARNFAAHGGTLALESRENEGTTVTMTLPLKST